MADQGAAAYAVWHIKGFRRFISARFFLTLGIQMQSVVVGWQVYSLTHDPFSLGIAGLAEAIPFLLSALWAGHIADRYDRKAIILITSALYTICAALLLLATLEAGHRSGVGILPVLYAILAVTGIIRAFFYPAHVAYLAGVVPRDLYTNSATWNSTIWHIAAVSGPALGGLVYGFAGPRFAYGLVVLFAAISFGVYLGLPKIPVVLEQVSETFADSLFNGLRFVWGNPVLLGAMALDMFAVLFGGAIAMLPAFASEILRSGPEALGYLRAAPALGAVIMSFVLAYHPPDKHSGKILLMAVAGFGMCYIGFALSKIFWLSWALLLLSGMLDNVSVIIRGTILQTCTPDAMRGRVAAVNGWFIGSSNELGSFESGLAARLLGLVPSVVFGGCMTLLVVGITAIKAPKLRQMSIADIKTALP